MDKRIQISKPVIPLTIDQRKDAINRAVQPYTLLYYRWYITRQGTARFKISLINEVEGQVTILNTFKRNDFNSSFDQAVIELTEHFPDLKIIGRVPNSNYLVCEYYDFTKSKD